MYHEEDPALDPDTAVTETPKQRVVRSPQENIENARHDLKTEWVDDVFPDANGVTSSVRIRALTAAQQAAVRNKAVSARQAGATSFDFTASDRLTFQHGVIEPKYTADETKSQHIKSGPSFSKIVQAIGELSNLDKESLDEAEADFPESDGE